MQVEDAQYWIQQFVKRGSFKPTKAAGPDGRNLDGWSYDKLIYDSTVDENIFFWFPRVFPDVSTSGYELLQTVKWVDDRKNSRRALLILSEGWVGPNPPVLYLRQDVRLGVAGRLTIYLASAIRSTSSRPIPSTVTEANSLYAEDLLDRAASIDVLDIFSGPVDISSDTSSDFGGGEFGGGGAGSDW